jgi:hypothetical protein
MLGCVLHAFRFADWEPAHRLPDGRMSKPMKRQIDAYQITVAISAGGPLLTQ